MRNRLARERMYRIKDSRNQGCWEMLGVRKTLRKTEANVMTIMKSVVECAVFLVCGDGADRVSQDP